jgi:hypothetical protein
MEVYGNNPVMSQPERIATPKTTMGTALLGAEQSSAEKVAEVEGANSLKEIHQKTIGAIEGLTLQMAKPKKVVRGEDGKVEGIQ